MKRAVIESPIPRMTTSSDVSPTIRLLGRDVVLSYRQYKDDYCAIIKFTNVKHYDYGDPNDEILNTHPLFGKGLEAYQFHKIIDDDATAQYITYIATFHDGLFEIITKGCEVIGKDLAINDPAGAINSLFGNGENRHL